MLRANKNPLFEKIFALYNRNLLKRRFHTFNAAGLEVLRQKDAGRPLIVYANHSSWWDGLVTFQIFAAAGLDGYVMMEEKQLKKLSPFRLLGAFSVVREKPREAVRSLRYAIELLQNDPRRTLLLFPQGEILPNDQRPLRFYRGLAKALGEVNDCDAVSMAIRYEFSGHFKPEIFVKIGESRRILKNQDFDSENLTADLAEDLTNVLNDLKADVAAQNFEHFEKIF